MKNFHLHVGERLANKRFLCVIHRFFRKQQAFSLWKKKQRVSRKKKPRTRLSEDGKNDCLWFRDVVAAADADKIEESARVAHTEAVRVVMSISRAVGTTHHGC
jgi:hypothetical protein